MLAAARLPLKYTAGFVGVGFVCFALKAVLVGDPDTWGERLAADLLGVAGGLLFGAAGLNAFVGRLTKREWARETGELVYHYTEIAASELTAIAVSCVEVGAPAIDTSNLGLAPVNIAFNLFWLPHADPQGQAWSDDRRALAKSHGAALVGTQNTIRDAPERGDELVQSAQASAPELAERVERAADAVKVLAQYRTHYGRDLDDQIAVMRNAITRLARSVNADVNAQYIASLNATLFRGAEATFGTLAKIVEEDGRATNETRVVIAG